MQPCQCYAALSRPPHGVMVVTTYPRKYTYRYSYTHMYISSNWVINPKNEGRHWSNLLMGPWSQPFFCHGERITISNFQPAMAPCRCRWPTAPCLITWQFKPGELFSCSHSYASNIKLIYSFYHQLPWAWWRISSLVRAYWLVACVTTLHIPDPLLINLGQAPERGHELRTF